MQVRVVTIAESCSIRVAIGAHAPHRYRATHPDPTGDGLATAHSA
jgi:hypothetical protein